MAREERFTAPLVIFLAYSAACFVVICAFKAFFPGRPEPLECYRILWRFSAGLIAFIHLFPALAFSALVIPFGLKEHSEGGYAGSAYVGDKSFSAAFLKYITWPVITAALAAALYAVFFFLALPLTVDVRASMEAKGALYIQARDKAKNSASARQWAEAAQFISICDQVWPGSEEIEKIRSGITDEIAAARRLPPEKPEAGDESETPIWAGIPGTPLTSADALLQAEEAFAKERYYDAHWLATLAERLAKPGNAEVNAALALASRAWDKIAAMEPNAKEKEQHALYRMKRDGYEAMNAGDWISAFYTFQELVKRTPSDPDAAAYLETSRNGVAELAFFIDELDLAIGNTLSGAVFSFPALDEGFSAVPGPDGGRLALRFASLALLPDFAYAWGLEAVTAAGGNFRSKASADYAKLVPVRARDSEGNPAERVVLLLRALERTSKEQRWDPVWIRNETGSADSGNTAAGIAGSAGDTLGPSRIMLDISYDDFSLLAKLKRGTGSLNLKELFIAEEKFGAYGYVREVFRAEILRRLADPVFFLPMTVLALILGWRYRARKKPRSVYVPMLGILPLGFYGAVFFYRTILNNLSIWLSLYFSFSSAMMYFIAGSAVCFILALAALAAQHG